MNLQAQTVPPVLVSGPAISSTRPANWWPQLAGAAVGCAVLGPAYGSPSATVMTIVFIAALTSSIAGFAFSAICGAMLFRSAGDPVQTVQILMTCSIANQILMVWSLRRDIVWRGLGVYLLGGALGLPLGVWVLLHTDRALYTHALGIFLLAFGAYSLVRKGQGICPQHPCLDLAAGIFGGITGGAAGFPSASVAIWCSLKGWNRARQRALCQPFILIMQLAALLAISVAKGASGGFNPGILFCVPASLLGTGLAMSCFQRLSNQSYKLAVNLLLIASGLSFVF